MITTRSLRWRLQAYYALLLLVALASLVSLSIYWTRQSAEHLNDSKLREYQHLLMPSLRSPKAADPSDWKVFEPLAPVGRNHNGMANRRGPRPMPPGGNALGKMENRSSLIKQLLKDEWYFGVFRFDGTPLRLSANFPDGIELSFEEPAEKGDIIIADKNHRSLMHREPGRIASVIGYPKGQLTPQIQKRQWIIISSGAALFLTATVIGWLLIQRSLRPIAAIRETAKDIADGKLTARINEATQQKNEIGILSENLNQTFEQLESMFERQKRFTSEASHELRTPISVILGYCQIALEKDRSAEQVRDAIHACRRAGERMKNLTNDLLELSRIESGEINFEFSPCSIKEIGEEALELIEPLADEKNLTLLDQMDEVSIEANSDRLWQVLVNLLSNAIRHTSEGKSITLKSTCTNDSVEISVIDEGEGIPSKDLPHIFNRFYRVDGSRNRKTGGSGLGLAISETIVKAHGGRLDVGSQISEGTTFTMTLPLKQKYK